MRYIADEIEARLGALPPSCKDCGGDCRQGPGDGRCPACARLAQAPVPRLGKHERAVLLACLERMPARERHWSPDYHTDELLQVVCGLEGESQRWWRHAVSAEFREMPVTRYPWTSDAERNRAQATLSRTIRTLYAKGLIDCGNVYEATGHRQAERHEYIKTVRLTARGARGAAQLTKR